jgi:hypothetical protein
VSHPRRLRPLVALTLALALVGVAVPFAAGHSANPDPEGTINKVVVNHEVTLDGTWTWPQKAFPCLNNYVGWAVDWGDGSAPGVRVGDTDWYVGTADPVDNAVHTNRDCGQSSSPLINSNGRFYAVGTWDGMTHTYADVGEYTACVLMYDIHLKARMRTTLTGAIDGVQTTIGVASVADLAISDDLRIGREQLRIFGITGLVLDVSRGFAASTAVAHRLGAKVKELVPKSATELLAGGPSTTRPVPATHNRDNSAETNGLAPSGGPCVDITISATEPDLSTQASMSQAQGNPLSDVATLGETGGNGPVTGVVDFFVCAPQPTAIPCTSGGTASGQDVPVVAGSAASGDVLPTEPGYYCFRAEYSGGSPDYLDTTDSNDTTECVLFDIT